MNALLDTHVLYAWVTADRELTKAQRRVVDRAGPERPLLVSDISLWELATLVELGRIRVNIALRDWLERMVAPPLVRRLDISPAIAAEVASLPSTFHRDPADRILVATARVHGAALVTSDRRIIGAGIVTTIS